MKTSMFVVRACAVFLVLGPLLPLPAMSVFAVIQTGDISKAISTLALLRLSWLSYVFGWPIALGFGLAFSLVCVAANRFVPVLSKTGPLAGFGLGALLGASLATFCEMVLMRGHHLPTFLGFLVVPAVTCGALVGCWFFPLLSDGFSLKSRQLTT